MHNNSLSVPLFLSAAKPVYGAYENIAHTPRATAKCKNQRTLCVCI